MNKFYNPTPESAYLCHSGIKGQKWGTRRWQNPDGSLTEAGKKHYGAKKKFEVNSDTKDEDIIRNVLGDSFDEVQKQVIAMQNGTNRNLTNDEIRQILGDNYDTIQKEILELSKKREESKKNKKHTAKAEVAKKDGESKKRSIQVRAGKVKNNKYYV